MYNLDNDDSFGHIDQKNIVKRSLEMAGIRVQPHDKLFLYLQPHDKLFLYLQPHDKLFLYLQPHDKLFSISLTTR